MQEERLKVHTYQCWDCDRVIFAFEKELPKVCPFCQCRDMMRARQKADVIVTEEEQTRA